MSRKIAKLLSALLLASALAVTQIPVSDVEATSASDFQMEGSKLLKYAGTAEVVSVPDGVKEIGEEAFAGNDNLVKVTIGNDVEKIGYRAFADCDSLRTVQIGDSVEEIETAAFSNNEALKNVTIGAGLKKVGSGVFAGCSLLSSLTLSEDNPYLFYEDGILYDDEEKTLYALMQNYKLTSLSLKDTVEEISAYAFWGNPYLEQVTLDSNLYSVPSYAFSNCINLKNVEIPLPVRSIEAKAFEDCINLTNVSLPDSMSNIHDTAFDGCYQVAFETTPGTYSAEFASAFTAQEADRIEYEDVQDSQILSEDEAEDTDAARDTVQTDTEEGVSEEDTDKEESNLPVTPTVVGGSSSGRLLGQTSIVAGRAVVFIDNSQAAVTSGDMTSSGQDTASADSSEKIGDILSGSEEKGKDFPKYTVVNNKIASQAFYQDEDLTEYEIGEDITEIGDFAFARSGLTSIVIPEGVEKIGYGAFYHCDNLTSVTIPSSVKEIAANAFEQTPWLTGMKNLTGSGFTIVGDGILLAYANADSVVNIPDGVKIIGAEVFKDHVGITAVNIPASVTEIGEAAFYGCRNLKTVNGGSNLEKVGDRAFQNCPLSQIVIPASMKEIGLAAYDCPGGTDTVTFEGTELPVLTMGSSAGRLSNEEARTYAFDKCKTAVIPQQTGDLEGTILESGTYGFHGTILDNAGNLVADTENGVTDISQSGITLMLSSDRVSEGENAMATMPGNTGSYVLKVQDSDTAAEEIAKAYGELYGGRQPSNLTAFDISLYDAAGQIPISKLGKQYVTVQFPLPQNLSEENLHLVTLDSDGQLEAVDYQIVNLTDGDYVQFTARHFSPYAFYSYTGYGGTGVVSDGSTFISLSGGNKDDTPDTGDFIHPKWILALGLLAASVGLFFYRGKSFSKKKSD